MKTSSQTSFKISSNNFERFFVRCSRHWSFMNLFLINCPVSFSCWKQKLYSSWTPDSFPPLLPLSSPCPPPPHPTNRSPWRAADHHSGSSWRFRWVDPDLIFHWWTGCLFLFGLRFNPDYLAHIQTKIKRFGLIHILKFLHPSAQKLIISAGLRFLQEVWVEATAQPAETENKLNQRTSVNFISIRCWAVINKKNKKINLY